MRKVKYKKWIDPVWIDNSSGQTLKSGTRCWESDFTNDGLFHQWASSSYEESSEGFGNFTVALIEIKDGTIVEILPCNIKFINE